MTSSHIDTLIVFIKGERAGSIIHHENGRLSFAYKDGYSGNPLSASMPISNKPYDDRRIRPYLMGLLPDSTDVRRAVAREYDVSANNPFALIAHIGLDLPGAVQVCANERDVERCEAYREITDSDIESRLAELIERDGASWLGLGEHWSLGGQQSKIALARFDGKWYSCEGSAATTHIIKPGITRLKFQALNEHYCLSLASACGIPSAKSEYLHFGDVPAIVVKRFDRIVHEPFAVERLHQEDVCQALGVLPSQKYASDGGPSSIDVVRLLGNGANATSNIKTFAAQLLFNYLIGGTDAHAKNYSLTYFDGDDYVLSPMYDAASVLPYDTEGRHIRLAMSIGGENRLGLLSKNDLGRYADAAGLDRGYVAELMEKIATSILENGREVAEREVIPFGGEELADRLLPKLDAACEKTLAMLARS